MENDEVPTTPIPLPKDQERRHFEWTTEIKVTMKMFVTMFDNEKRAKGRGFMKRVKRWDQYYPETEMQVGRSYIKMLLDSRTDLKL